MGGGLSESVTKGKFVKQLCIPQKGFWQMIKLKFKDDPVRLEYGLVAFAFSSSSSSSISSSSSSSSSGSSSGSSGCSGHSGRRSRSSCSTRSSSRSSRSSSRSSSHSSSRSSRIAVDFLCIIRLSSCVPSFLCFQ